MNFTRDEKVDILLIIISTISVIASFILSLDHISWIAVVLCGVPIFKECIEGLITEFDIKADLLVTIAIIASIIIGEVFAAGEIATIMAIGGFLEEYTVNKTQGRIEELVNMTPQIATRIKGKVEEKIPVEDVKIGDILKVLPGESIPTDGTILSGETSIDQSTLTGESIPVDKKVNDEVYSGTINLYGSFTMKTTKVSEDSSLQKLIKLVESSKPENAKIVRSADRWATWIVVIAFLSAIITYFVTGEIIRSVTILVVFCPCALVLATPTAIMAAIGNLTKYGILVKDGESLEELAHVNELVFDKTGTLTYGTPEVVRVVSKDNGEMMHLVASLESKSEHPLAKSIVKYYDSTDLAEVNEFKMHIGKGVTGIIGNSKVTAGNMKLLESEDITSEYVHDATNGEIEIYVAKDNEVIGKIYLADTLRNNSKQTIKKLKRLGIKTTLLTGDNEETGRYIARQVKVTNAQFNCLPEDKTEYIKEEQLKDNKVAMIGDGINDAPSLRKANVGIAMGSIGSDVSIEASNIALINDNIGDIPHLIGIARKTLNTINLNIAFSLALNIIAMILAVLGILDPIAGALIHNIGSVIVIIYSSTLVNYKLSRKDYLKSKKLGMTKSLNKSIS
ncbi:MAG: cation-translocating P-type ATPase [Methanobrevibacter sp.]|uniref:heavy metal translocating P-type ATPase n=1 Tax=Methanobrevibacter sp. TaxID=66852 RepID=UPI001B6969D3|nr:cation-translocating P-type ATPase [Methanobrevibacter sp.]MBP3790909.1 cation-translocating P-type ATPase [Methanobrevibacter sp.]